jgi:hypothetical protein
MKNLIYQYWDGPLYIGVQSGRDVMNSYADRIGCDYLFEHNPKFRTDLGNYSPHYGQFKVIYDDYFLKYDNILFADTDVFPVHNLKENIFEECMSDDTEIGISHEWSAAKSRKKYDVGGIHNANDERWVKLIENTWPVKMPRTVEGLPEVYNSGVVLYSKEGRAKAKSRFVDFKQYVNLISRNNFPSFYTCDQPYLHAMLEVCNFNWKTIDYKWNSSVHYVPQTSDPRPVNDFRFNANFVHIQLRNADNFDAEKLWKITNLPVNEWGIY